MQTRYTICPAGTCDRPVGHEGQHAQFDGPPARDSLGPVEYWRFVQAGCALCGAKAPRPHSLVYADAVYAICRDCARDGCLPVRQALHELARQHAGHGDELARCLAAHAVVDWIAGVVTLTRQGMFRA